MLTVLTKKRMGNHWNSLRMLLIASRNLKILLLLIFITKAEWRLKILPLKYKRLKDPQTGDYKNYPYPKFIDIPFNPDTDEYPYPVDAIDMTYDGLHPSDKGFQVIADMLVKILKKY